MRVVIGATDVALATSRPTNLSIRTILSGEVVSIRSQTGAVSVIDIALQGGGRLAASVTRLAVSLNSLQGAAFTP